MTQGNTAALRLFAPLHLLVEDWCVRVFSFMRSSSFFLSATVCLSLQPSEKCGVLNVTKITENGKKVR